MRGWPADEVTVQAAADQICTVEIFVGPSDPVVGFVKLGNSLLASAAFKGFVHHVDIIVHGIKDFRKDFDRL